MLSITKTFEFEAAHFLPGYPGPCRNIHGHSYKLEVEVARKLKDENTNLDAFGMILDFSCLKSLVNDVILSKVDHQLLNNLLEKEKLVFPTPSAEKMVLVFQTWLRKNLPDNVKLIRVRLWETSSSYVEVKENE